MSIDSGGLITGWVESQALANALSGRSNIAAVRAGALSRVIGFALHKVQSASTRWKRAILRRS